MALIGPRHPYADASISDTCEAVDFLLFLTPCVAGMCPVFLTSLVVNRLLPQQKQGNKEVQVAGSVVGYTSIEAFANERFE